MGLAAGTSGSESTNRLTEIQQCVSLSVLADELERALLIFEQLFLTDP